MTVVVVNGNIMGVHDVYMHEIQVGVQSIHVGDTCRSRNVLVLVLGAPTPTYPMMSRELMLERCQLRHVKAMYWHNLERVVL